jgi:subfamily B ATP-binding cassette protein MsbA
MADSRSSPTTAAKPRLADVRTQTLAGRLMREHVRPQGRRIAFALGCMTVVAATTAALAKQMEPILDQVFAERSWDTLVNVSLSVLAIFVVKGIAGYGQAVAMNHVGQRIVADLQRRLFDHLMAADLAFFHDNAPGQLISRFTYDTTLMRNAVSSTLTSLGKDLLTLIFLVGLMLYQDWRLACVAFVIGPPAAIAIARLGRRMRKVSKSSQMQTGELTGLLDEAFQGARQVKAYGMEAYESARAGAAVERLFGLLTKAARVRAATHPIFETLGGVAIVAVMLYGGHQVMEGGKTPGAFFSFITALLLAYEPLKRLANLNAQLQEGLAAAERVFALLDSAPGIVDRPGARPLVVSGGGVALRDVSFGYGDDARAVPALDGLDLTVPAGATVALVGASGAGKSTVLNLIPRFFDVTAGHVTIDGQDVRDVTLASLRGALALVSQESMLFDDTVRANILYGRPDATDDQVIEAARAANAHEFIQALPDGYATDIGQRGVKLSGGQKQRLTIARAFLKDPPILIFDEATSALDTVSERAVQQALLRLARARTTLVIAHRLSTVRHADRILVLGEGGVVEEGPHDRLVAAGGSYARLYSVQASL